MHVSGVSIRAGHQANGPAVGTILPACFDHLQECFSYIEVQLKKFCLPVKAILLKTFMKPLMCESYLTIKSLSFYLL